MTSLEGLVGGHPAKEIPWGKNYAPCGTCGRPAKGHHKPTSPKGMAQPLIERRVGKAVMHRFWGGHPEGESR